MKNQDPSIPDKGTVSIPTAEVQPRPARGWSMATRDPDVIRAWAARHGAEPATGEATSSGPATVQVNDGATTVIGGIFVSNEQTTNNRTPALHRVPLLRWLFQQNTLNDSSRELLIFITPRILRG